MTNSDQPTRPLTLLERLHTHRRTRSARNAGADELGLYVEIERSLLTLASMHDYQAQAVRAVGLQRELELELFGEIQPMQADGGAEVTARAVAVVKQLKEKAGTL
jgi:hypothetical protein